MTVLAPGNGSKVAQSQHQPHGLMPTGPGKTAPRLIHDAVLLDPRDSSSTFDILASPAPFFDDSRAPQQIHSENSCHHDYGLNYPRSALPPKDFRAAAGYAFNAEALCRKCRIHIHVDIRYSPTGRRPCPNPDYPLHHLVLKDCNPSSDYSFVCSSGDCGALVSIKYHPPVITDSDLDLLTNPALLKQRYDAAVSQNTERQGFVPATPINTLWKLRRYIRDALESKAPGKKIPVQNKRYMESFGDDTAELLKRLGFTLKIEDDEEFWMLPFSSPDSTSSDRIFLENWNMELQAVIEHFAARDGDLNPDPSYIWIPARNEIDRTLGAQNYAKSAQSKREDSSVFQDHPYYASLGAMRDFADNLIEFAFDRQSDCDPQHGPYYFDCLQDLASGRQSESLQLKSTILESQGITGRKDVVKAYRSLGLDPNATYTDEHIINLYRSRVEDSSPAGRQELRTVLRRLGTARQSQSLIDSASDTIDTYQQALSWLGAEASYPDDSILTLHTTKISDNPGSTALARRAVDVIAKTRNSDPLRSWLSTGEMRDSGMSVDDACKHLNIKLDTVDDTTLQLVVDGAKRDNPGWKTDQAIEVVTKAYRRPASGPSHDPSTWPVGLTSHGNTCYLNSLLQYYFTIKPLRDKILNFDDYKFDLSRHGGKIQRVGARKVTPLEIRAYQNFVNDLRHLFDRMIKDPGPAVKPDADLVCRAFLKAEDTESQTAPVSRAQSPPADIGIEQPPPKPPRPTSGTQHAPPKMDDSPSTASSVTLGGPDEPMPDALTTSQILPDTPPGTPPGAATNGTIDPDSLHAPPLPPRPTSTPVRQQTNLAKAEEAARQQQDVTEVMDEILFRLRCAIRADGQDSREEQLDAFRDIFYMRISEKTLMPDNKLSSREEYAMNILLNIPSRPTDIYAALDEIFELQAIEHGDKKVRQYKTIQSCPPVLQINIPRNTYDRTTGRGVKVEHKVHLEEILYLDRYFEWQDGEILRRREESWGWRQQLELLQGQRDVINRDPAGIDGPTKLRTVSKYMKELQKQNAELIDLGLPPFDIDDAITNNLNAVAEAQQSQLDMIAEQITSLQTRISTSFEGHNQLKYRLAAVFFHRGGYGHGHYWSCIYDFQSSMWRIYNDEKVEKFEKVADIFDAETWQQGTPTYAVYVKDDEKEELIQPVCRMVERQNEEVKEIVDEIMQDAPPPQPKRSAPQQPLDDVAW